MNSSYSNSALRDFGPRPSQPRRPLTDLKVILLLMEKLHQTISTKNWREMCTFCNLWIMHTFTATPQLQQLL